MFAGLSRSLREKKIQVRRALLPRARRPDDVVRQGGPVVIAGTFQTANGIGRAARSCFEALKQEGLEPIAVDLSAIFNQVDVPSCVPLSALPPLGIPGTLILCANPPEVERALYALGFRRWHNWKIIGAWAWELPVAPPEWSRQAEMMSEIWAPSDFVREAFEKSFATRVCTVPHYMADAVNNPETPPPAPRHNETLRFVTLADGRSSLERKNVIGAIRMFSQAFDGGQDVSLIVKCRNLQMFSAYRNDIVELLQQDSRIRLVDQTLARKEHDALLRECDVLLSCHRAEGFGVHLAEAMAAGRTAVATGWSGNLQFMNDANSYLLPYSLKPVRDSSGIYTELADTFWADVDLAEGIRTLRRIHDNPDERLEIGYRAQLDIARNLGSAVYRLALQSGS